MNGELTEKGKELLTSFYKISHAAGYDHLIPIITEHITDKYLQEGKLSKEEHELLQQQTNFLQHLQRRRIKSTLPPNCEIKDLPKYTYYHPESKQHGGYFVIEGHPLQKIKWISSTSKNIQIKDKYQQMMSKIKELDINNNYNS